MGLAHTARRPLASILLSSVLLPSLFAASPALAQSAATPPSGTPSASVQSSRDEAISRFRRGLELYDEQDFNAALIEFRKAYEKAPNYKVLYNVGQVCFQLQDYACALRSFDAYLFEGSSEITTERRKEVQLEIAKLQPRVAKLEIHTNVAQTEISIDDVLIGKAPLAGPVLVSAGKRRIFATHQGYAPVSRTLDVPGNETVKVELTLVELARAPVADVERPSKFTTLSWVGIGAAGALAAGAITTGILAMNASSSVQETPFVGTTPGSDLEAQQANAQGLAVASDVLAITAVATLGVTLFLTLTSSPPATKEAARTAVVSGARPRAGSFLRGAF